MEERLHAVLREFADVADIWTPGEIFAKARRCDRFKSVTRIGLDETGRKFCRCQPESLDLVVSALAFQFVNDLPGVLAQIRRALRPDGLLLAAMLGGDTLTELRQCFAAAEAECEGGVSPRVAPFADLRDVGALLQRAGFALPVTDVDRVVVRYDSAFALMQDLRRMGATNILVERRRTPTRRATLLRMAQIYARTLRRSRRPHPRHLRCDLAVGLGAACKPAKAAAAGLGESEPGGGGEEIEPRLIVSPELVVSQRAAASFALLRRAETDVARHINKSIKCGISGMSAGGIG